MSKPNLSTAELIVIDEVCDRFENAWKLGEAPSIDDFVTLDGASRAQLLAELIQIDQAFRAKQGTQLEIDVYALRFAEHADEIRRIVAANRSAKEKAQGSSWRLRVVAGPHAGVVRILTGSGKISLGRGSQEDLSLPDDPRCSREHAVIVFSPASCTILDAASKNGVYVNGERTRESDLTPGDFIQLGATELRIEVENPP